MMISLWLGGKKRSDFIWNIDWYKTWMMLFTGSLLTLCSAALAVWAAKLSPWYVNVYQTWKLNDPKLLWELKLAKFAGTVIKKTHQLKALYSIKLTLESSVEDWHKSWIKTQRWISVLLHYFYREDQRCFIQDQCWVWWINQFTACNINHFLMVYRDIGQLISESLFSILLQTSVRYACVWRVKLWPLLYLPDLDLLIRKEIFKNPGAQSSDRFSNIEIPTGH